MSVSAEVQRTLVKSPPELWAELSDPAALARHLGELGHIRIVGTVPERTIDWEAAGGYGARVSGRIQIEPSGWGTRVTLFASRAHAEPAPALQSASIGARSEPQPRSPASSSSAAQPQPQPTSPPPLDPKPALQPHTDTRAEPEPHRNSQATPAPAPEPEPVEPGAAGKPADHDPVLGFFARLFRRRNRHVPQPPAICAQQERPAPQEPVEETPRAELLEEEAPRAELLSDPTRSQEPGEPSPGRGLAQPTEPQPTEPLRSHARAPADSLRLAGEPIELARAHQHALHDSPHVADRPIELARAEPTRRDDCDLAAELADLERQTTAVLTSVLDRLGAAHHRPFSRT